MASQSTCTRSSRRSRRPRLHRGWSRRRTLWSTTVLRNQPRERTWRRTLENRRKTRSRSKSPRNQWTENRPSRGKMATCVLIADCRARNRVFCKNTSELTQMRGRILVCLAGSRSRPSRISTSIAGPALTPSRWRVVMPARYVLINFHITSSTFF